jgi:hypothetical protein
MADKEATVFVIDLGASMGKKTQGREMTNLDWSMQYVWDKITAKVYAQHDESLRLRYSLGGRQMSWDWWDFVQRVRRGVEDVDSQEQTMTLAMRKHTTTSPFSSQSNSFPAQFMTHRRILMPQIQAIKKLCVVNKNDKGDGRPSHEFH